MTKEQELQNLIDFLISLYEPYPLWKYSQAFLEHTYNNKHFLLKKEENGSNSEAYIEYSGNKVYFNNTVQEALEFFIMEQK